MNPRALLQRLMDRDGLNSNSLAERLNNATTQPQIHKFLSGKAKEPRRSTLAPVARYFRIPLDALYDADIAVSAAKQKQLVSDDLEINQSLAPTGGAQPATKNIASMAADATSGGQLQALYDMIPAGPLREPAYNACFEILMQAMREARRAASPPTDDTAPAQSQERRSGAHQ